MKEMNYGVTITDGASPWQIFQQENGSADIRIKGEYTCVRLSQELPLTFTALERRAHVRVRVALEQTGESVLPWQDCEVTRPGHWQACLRGVPAGGLYRIETYMEFEGWDGLSVTRGDMVHHLGVGDVFVIAGQSNAAGRAKSPVEDAPELGVHVLRPSGRWDIATHPLGETTDAVYIGNFENHNPGHSPFLHFAKRLRRELGYPIGLVPCAYGGAPLRWWNPDENGSLFENMLATLGGLSPCGVLWYQGEAEGYEDSAATYGARFHSLVVHARRALGRADLPFITVQLNRCVNEGSSALDTQWGLVRDAQRRAMHDIPHVYTVPSCDVALYDFIHNAPEGNLIIGERCARAALANMYGRRVDWRAPEVVRVRRTGEARIRITLAPVQNWINPYDVPADLLPFDAQDAQGLAHPCAYTVGRDTLELTFARPLEGGAVLHGAWRMNPGAYIPCDCMRLPMLSFYGMTIPDEITGEEAV